MQIFWEENLKENQTLTSRKQSFRNNMFIEIFFLKLSEEFVIFVWTFNSETPCTTLANEMKKKIMTEMPEPLKFRIIIISNSAQTN